MTTNTNIALGPVLSASLGSFASGIANQSHPVIYLIERLSPTNLALYGPKAFELFEYSFPNPDEREPIADITARIERYIRDGPDPDGGEFHAHVFLDKNSRILGYSQGSTMPCGTSGLTYFWQYGAVADEEYLNKAYALTKDSSSARNKGVCKLMHLVNTLTVEHQAKRFNQKALGELWETEEKGFGETSDDIRFTFDRLAIHNKSGGRVMMGVSATEPSFLVNLHLQPRLSKELEPIALHLMFRSFDPPSAVATLDKKLAEDIIIEGFLENFTKEGFDQRDVQDAKKEIRARFNRCRSIVLLPESQVPNAIQLAETDELFRNQLLAMYQVQTMQEAREKFEKAIA